MRRAYTPFAVLLLLGAPGAARAGSFQVNPTRIDFSPSVKTAVVTVTNRGPGSLRFQVKTAAWQQSDDGQMETTPTGDVVVYPMLFELKAGSSRALRIGVRQRPSARERSYRVFVEELPPVRTTRTGSRINVLTRMSIPAFVAPGRPVVNGAVEGISVSGGQIALAVTNRGTVHFQLSKIRLTGKDKGGAAIFSHTAPAWYVLAGGRRNLRVPVAASVCKRLARLEATAESDVGIFRAAAHVNDSQCTAPL